eukprot:TRINITY_DN8041_c0_g1_i1.p1 TRINITY_DN8041_c0_g1~~TRINITY_DN8041_c0_g1_i1.p1  ORF type:complete len:659 (+),score=82.75 TRINITY_DN8041_c0_g1_i1:208-2184(+)
MKLVVAHNRVEQSMQPLAQATGTSAVRPESRICAEHSRQHCPTISQIRPANVPQGIHVLPRVPPIPTSSSSPRSIPAQSAQTCFTPLPRSIPAQSCFTQSPRSNPDQSCLSHRQVQRSCIGAEPQQKGCAIQVERTSKSVSRLTGMRLGCTQRDSTHTQAAEQNLPIQQKRQPASPTVRFAIDEDDRGESKDRATALLSLLDCVESQVDQMAERHGQNDCFENRTNADVVENCHEHLTDPSMLMPEQQRVMIENLLFEIERSNGLSSQRQDDLRLVNAENVKFREHLRACSGRGNQFMGLLESARAAEVSLGEQLAAEKSEVRRLKDLLSEERRKLGNERLERERDRQEAARDRAEMLAEIDYLKGKIDKCCNFRDGGSTRCSIDDGGSSSCFEKKEINLGRAADVFASADVASSGDESFEHGYGSAALSDGKSTPRSGATGALDGGSVSVREILTEMGPFHRASLGINISLSEEGYVATRTRGSRHSVVIGSTPLSRFNLGYYFEVEVSAIEDGWINGLALGVTFTRPDNITRMPDKASRIPDTFVVGYNGCVFVDGQELRTTWRADLIPVGSKVGCLVSSNGDIRIFCDGDVVLRVGRALADMIKHGVKMFPVVDVYSATKAVKLSKYPAVPGLPWRNEGDAPVTTVGSNRGSGIM